MGKSVVARAAVAAAGVASLAALFAAGCSLLVGDVHGTLVADSGEASANDANDQQESGSTESGPKESGGAESGLGDSGPPGDGASSGDATVDGGAAPGDAATDGDASGGCNFDLDADTKHCGWCTHACATGSTCSGGSCTALLIWPADPIALAYDKGTLFGAGLNNNSIVAWSITSATSTTITTPQNAASNLLPRSPYLYWLTADGLVHRVLEDGGAQTTVGQTANAGCMAVNSTRVYWWEPGGAYSMPVVNDGGAVPTSEYPAGPGVTGCVNASDQELVIATGSVLLQRDLDSGAATIAMLPGPAEVKYLPLAGANTVVFTDSVHDAGADAAADSGAVTMHLGVVPARSTSVNEIASFPQTAIVSMAADDAGIYWAPQAGARVDGCQDVNCTGGVHNYVAATPGSAIGNLALDSTYIYFTMSGPNAGVFRVAR